MSEPELSIKVRTFHASIVKGITFVFFFLVKGLLSRSVRLLNSPYCFVLKGSDHIEHSSLCEGPQLLPVFPHLPLHRRPIATGLFVWLAYGSCCDCVLMIKMTCAVNWDRRAKSTSLSYPDLPGSRGKTVSRHLELSPGAVDDHDFCCALSCSLCSALTFCCIAIWAFESK